MAFDWQNFFLGSNGATPGQYYTPYQDRNQIQQYVQQGMAGANQAAPQLDPTQQAQFRQMQMNQAQQLAGIASGQQQGAGELAVQRQVANAQAAQQAMARMNRGAGAGMGYLNAARQTAGIGLSGAGQAQQAQMQDQMNAQQMLTGALGQGRGQDIGLAGQNANLAQQQYGLNTQRGLGYLNSLTGMNQGELNAQANMFGAIQQNHGILGSVLGSGGQYLANSALPTPAASDERLKTDVRDAGRDLDDMLDKLVAKSYRYKNEAKHGEGERTGIMAQDLERSKAGKALVVDLPSDPGYKGFDVAKAVSAALASAARLNERMRKAGI